MKKNSPSIKRGLIAQNVYSAKKLGNGSDCQTKPNLRGRYCANSFPVERSPIHTRIGGQEITAASCGTLSNMSDKSGVLV